LNQNRLLKQFQFEPSPFSPLFDPSFTPHKLFHPLVMLKLTNPTTQTKNFLGDDPGGTTVTKGHQTVNSDSDSGLDTHSLGSNGGGGARETKDETRGTSQSESEDNRPEEPLKIETDVPKTTANQLTRNPTIVLPDKCRAKRRKMPFMGLAIRRNPDLSQIALNESKLRLACYECGNKMAKRQPLVKTNGILFMKNREEHVLEQFGIFENYENCAEQAFTRSEIVQGWNYELKEHRLYCRSEIEQMGFYQRRFSEKYGTRTQNNERNTKLYEQDDKTENVLNSFDQSEVVSSSTNEKKTTISKFSEKLRQKMKRSKSRDTLSSSNSSNSTDSNFEPPPAARPTKPEVKSKPASDITDINFSGILGSNTVLRQHCEQCVLRDKPEDFRSVLFVCQL